MGLFLKSIVAALFLIISIIQSPSAGAQEEKVYEVSSRKSLSWTELIFKGSKVFTSTTVKINISSGDQLSDNLSTDIEPDFGDCSTTLNSSKLLTVHTSSKSVGLFQSQYQEKIWFKETTFRPDKRIRLSNGGGSPWLKSYCWEAKGVRRQKFQPGNPGENKQPPNKWTKRTESFYEYPEEVAGCDTISDPALVFYLLSTFESTRQPKYFEICVFGRKQLYRLTMERKKSSPLKVSYKTGASSQETAVKEQINPSVFSITAETLVPDKRVSETFSFFGLHKDILIFMDPEKRLPVRISGKNNSIGSLVLDLRAYTK